MGASIMGALLLSAPVWADVCDPDYVDLRGDWGKARFMVEIADDPGERAQGLMHRESMPMSHGMLFLFETPQTVSFWMKNTLIPLDMLFLTADGTVARVHQNAIPHDTSLIPGGSDIFAVLEVNGGISERFGISEGTVLRHPLLDQSIAAWPCAATE